MSLTYEEMMLPTSAVDVANYNNLLLNIKIYNVVIILATVVPLIGTLVTTVLGALALSYISNDTLILCQTILSAIICFICALCVFLKTTTLNSVKDLSPALKAFITIFSDTTIV